VSSAMAGGSFGAGFVGSSAAMTASSSFVTGAAIGGSSGASSGFITGSGNAWMGDSNFGQGLGQGVKYGIIGGISGAAIGGLAGGISAYRDGRDFWHGGRLTTDVSMPLPQMNQAPNTNDCRYETFRSMDTYYNGETMSVKDLRAGFPNAEIRDVELAKMYGSRGMALHELDVTRGMPKSEIAQKMATSMQQNRGIHYEFNISKGMNHAVGVSRVRVFDNGRIIVNFMNASGAGGYSTRNFNQMTRLFSVFKF